VPRVRYFDPEPYRFGFAHGNNLSNHQNHLPLGCLDAVLTLLTVKMKAKMWAPQIPYHLLNGKCQNTSYYGTKRAWKQLEQIRHLFARLFLRSAFIKAHIFDDAGSPSSRF
jgi:hypothetical protein